MRTFGNVRSVRNRELFAMASGATQTSLENVRLELAKAQEERVVLANKLSDAQNKVTANDNKYALGNQRWVQCTKTECGGTKRKCNACKSRAQLLMDQALRDRPIWANQLAVAQDNLAQKDSQISNIQKSIETLLIAIAKENEAELELAGQGLTSEAVQIAAQAQAEAEVVTAQQDAQTKAATGGVKRTILILIVAAIVIVGAIVIIKRVSKSKAK